MNISKNLLGKSVDFDVTDHLTELIAPSKNASLRNDAELKRALFTIGLITKHFELADIVHETARVCNTLVLYINCS